MPPRRPTEAERAERREADRRRAQEAVEALRCSEGWQRWLGARRHFHSYSFGNQLLIAQQCPGASAVAGFKAWLRLGYCVRRGETALRIFAAEVCPTDETDEQLVCLVLKRQLDDRGGARSAMAADRGADALLRFGPRRSA